MAAAAPQGAWRGPDEEGKVLVLEENWQPWPRTRRRVRGKGSWGREGPPLQAGKGRSGPAWASQVPDVSCLSPEGQESPPFCSVSCGLDRVSPPWRSAASPGSPAASDRVWPESACLSLDAHSAVVRQKGDRASTLKGSLQLPREPQWEGAVACTNAAGPPCEAPGWPLRGEASVSLLSHSAAASASAWVSGGCRWAGLPPPLAPLLPHRLPGGCQAPALPRGRRLVLPLRVGGLHGAGQLRHGLHRLQGGQRPHLALPRARGLPGAEVPLLDDVPRGPVGLLHRLCAEHHPTLGRIRHPGAQDHPDWCPPGGVPGHPELWGQGRGADLHPGLREHHLPGQSGALRPPLQHARRLPGQDSDHRVGGVREQAQAERDAGGGRGCRRGDRLRGAHQWGAVQHRGGVVALRRPGLLAGLLRGHLRRLHVPPPRRVQQRARDHHGAVQDPLPDRRPLRPAADAPLRAPGGRLRRRELRLPLLPALVPGLRPQMPAHGQAPGLRKAPLLSLGGPAAVLHHLPTEPGTIHGLKAEHEGAPDLPPGQPHLECAFPECVAGQAPAGGSSQPVAGMVGPQHHRFWHPAGLPGDEGAAIGRLVGEAAAFLLPQGVASEGVTSPITPGAYALAGAAAFSGAVTHTLSTALLAFEMTGQIAHILPLTLAVLVANAIAQKFQPSFYDGTIIVKKLPYLPRIRSRHMGSYTVTTREFMKTDFLALPKDAAFQEVLGVVTSTGDPEFPVIDSAETSMLVGLVQRSELIRFLQTHEDASLPHKEPEGEVPSGQALGDACAISPVTLQLSPWTSLHQAHHLFELLNLQQAFVTQMGQIVGVVSRNEIRKAIEDLANPKPLN